MHWGSHVGVPNSKQVSCLNSSLVERLPAVQKVWRFKPRLGHVCFGMLYWWMEMSLVKYLHHGYIQTTIQKKLSSLANIMCKMQKKNFFNILLYKFKWISSMGTPCGIPNMLGIRRWTSGNWSCQLVLMAAICLNPLAPLLPNGRNFGRTTQKGLDKNQSTQ